jgi:hypothetical protein
MSYQRARLLVTGPGLGVDVGVGVTVGVGVGVAVGLGVGIAVGAGVGVGVGICGGVGFGVGVTDGAGVGVTVGDGVGAGVAVGAGVGMAVGAGTGICGGADATVESNSTSWVPLCTVIAVVPGVAIPLLRLAPLFVGLAARAFDSINRQKMKIPTTVKTFIVFLFTIIPQSLGIYCLVIGCYSTLGIVKKYFKYFVVNVHNSGNLW